MNERLIYEWLREGELKGATWQLVKPPCGNPTAFVKERRDWSGIDHVVQLTPLDWNTWHTECISKLESEGIEVRWFNHRWFLQPLEPQFARAYEGDTPWLALTEYLEAKR